MNSKQKQILFLSILFLILFFINYKTIDSFLIKTFENQETVFVQRIIDGDTIVANNQTIRLLGINSPEKGEKYSNEAKEFLENLILEKEITIESFGTDLYKRTLAYVFLGSKNINLEIVKNGFANPYFPEGKQKYYSEFQEAWKNCVNNGLNFCKTSTDKCASCITLNKFDYKNEIIILKNSCSFDCDLTSWTIKDEGRKKFTFPNFILEKHKQVAIMVGEGTDTKDKLFWHYKTYVWTDSGDTLFLRDKNNDLILWESY
jgi:micrococcal nuclease